MQYLDFQLLPGDKTDIQRNRYNIINKPKEPYKTLPLLSRGERDIDDSDEDFEDTMEIPSCSELKRMWKIARRLHNHAIKTNEIPQKLHPFSSFESDRFRASQRFKSPKNKSFKYNNRKKIKTKGSKEIAETSYGLIRYAPSDPVKRPGSGNGIYKILKDLNPEVEYNENKDAGAWATGIREFEPESRNIRPFDSLRNKLRQDKKLPPMPNKDESQRSDYWGKVITHYKNKEREQSSFDKVKEKLYSDKYSGLSSARLNYRDDTSGPIGSVSDTTFGQHWKHRKFDRKNERRQKNKKRKKGRSRKKNFRGTKQYKLQNFLMKGQH